MRPLTIHAESLATLATCKHFSLWPKAWWSCCYYHAYQLVGSAAGCGCTRDTHFSATIYHANLQLQHCCFLPIAGKAHIHEFSGLMSRLILKLIEDVEEGFSAHSRQAKLQVFGTVPLRLVFYHQMSTLVLPTFQ